MDTIVFYFAEFFGFGLFVSAMMVGSFIGSLRDPVFLTMLALFIILGLLRGFLTTAIFIAFACAALRFGIAYGNRIQQGLSEYPPNLFSPAVTMLTLLLVWSLVRLATWVVGGKSDGV